jgi:hypothetical protein
MRLSTERAVILAIMAISLVTLGLQALVLRPRLWPAGAGLALSGEHFARLTPPSPISVIRPPDTRDGAAGNTFTVVRVVPGGQAAREGIHDGDRAVEITLNSCSFNRCPGTKFESLIIPLDGTHASAQDTLLAWRVMHCTWCAQGHAHSAPLTLSRALKRACSL